ncbi:hypothetical protein [Altererythrobacter sp. MF3-039]
MNVPVALAMPSRATPAAFQWIETIRVKGKPIAALWLSAAFKLAI